MSRFILPGLTGLALFAFSITASGQDLKAAAAQQKLAAQKIIDQVGDAIDFSRKQAPIDAKFSLQKILRQVQSSADLLDSERAPLVQRLQARIRIVDEAARAKTILQDQRPAPRDSDRPKYTRPTSDASGGVGSVAKGFQDSAKGAAKINSDTYRERVKGVNSINLAAEKGVLTDKDITFPPYWKELKKQRDKMFGPQLTAKEVALLKTLNSTMSVDYDGDKFKAVLNHIQDKTGLSIIVDEASLGDAGLDYDAPVTFKIPKVTVRTILKKVLGDKGLTYIIKEGTIQVMTPKKAAEYTVVRTYQVDDLVQGSPQAQMMFGPFIAQQQMLQNAQQLINLLQATIEPSYWQPNGPGSIAFYPPTKSLIIRGSAEMHYQLGAPGLFGGR